MTINALYTHGAPPLCWRAPDHFTMPRIRKNPGIDFYSGFMKNAQGEGVQLEILKIQVESIDFYSGFRETSQGGGDAIRNPKESFQGGGGAIPKS